MTETSVFHIDWYRLVSIFEFAFLLVNSEMNDVMAKVFLAPKLAAALALHPTMFVKFNVKHGMYLRIPFIEIRLRICVLLFPFHASTIDKHESNL